MFFCLNVKGWCTPLLGNTLVHLEYIFHVSTATMSIALMVQAVGALLGSILCGLVFDRVNHELAFAVASLIQGLSTILAPFIGGLVPFMVAMCLQATSIGFIMAGMCGMVLTTICFEQFVNGLPTNLFVFQYQF